MKFVANAINKPFHHDANCLRIYHQFSLAERIGRGKLIGFPIFELDKFNSRELHHLSYPDEICVCSKWAANIIKDQVKRESHVVPLGVNTEIFKPAEPRSDSTYVFLNIGKWEYRKGHDLITKAFNYAFGQYDDVELWMMNHNPFLKPHQVQDWENLYKNTKLGDKIRFQTRVSTHHEVSKIMEQACCGLFPARAEGWNLELLEMMAVNRPVITTNYSAHTEFCNKDNSYLLEVTETEPAEDGIWFHKQGNWAKLTQNHIKALAEFMRHCYTKDIRTNQHGIETAKKFSWENTYNELSKVVL